MRDLIKKIILEYTSNKEGIEIIDLSSILSESEIKFLVEGKATVNIPKHVRSLVEETIKKFLI